MSDNHPTTLDEVAQALEFARASFATFEDRVSAILAVDQPSQGDLLRAFVTSKRIIGAAASFCRAEATGKKPLRGVGYTNDEAMIVASLPWHDGNLSAAIRAHYATASPEEVQVHARRIRGRRAEIEEVEGELPWETSRNWLGDLIAE